MILINKNLIKMCVGLSVVSYLHRTDNTLVFAVVWDQNNAELVSGYFYVRTWAKNSRYLVSLASDPSAMQPWLLAEARENT